MVVVVARCEERRVDPDLASVGDQREPEKVTVERDRAVQFGDPQVDVSDADGGVDWLGVHGGSVLPGEEPSIREFIYPTDTPRTRCRTVVERAKPLDTCPR